MRIEASYTNNFEHHINFDHIITLFLLYLKQIQFQL